MGSGDTAADKSVSGYVAKETIALAVVPSATTYAWALTKPSGSNGAATLTDNGDGAAEVTPDVQGLWLVTCTVDGSTVYRIRISVLAAAMVTTVGAHRFTPTEDAAVPAPIVGASVYYSADAGTMVEKHSDGSIRAPTTLDEPNAGQRRIVSFDGSGFVGQPFADLPTTANAAVTSPADGARVFYSTELAQPVVKGVAGRTERLGAFLNIYDFGAVGDGVTDDTGAIDTAATVLAARGGGILVFPTGTFKRTTNDDLPSGVVALVMPGVAFVS